MTEPEPLQQVNRTYVVWSKRRLSYFSGCDYFRLASDPRVLLGDADVAAAGALVARLAETLAPLEGMAGTAAAPSEYTRNPRRQHHPEHHGRPRRQLTHARLARRAAACAGTQRRP